MPPWVALGELAALGWLVESLSRQDALQAHAARVLPLDFDEFTADVEGQLTRVLAHFDLPADREIVARIARGPVLRRYSKAPEQPFSPDERAARLAHSRRDNRAEIARGMSWLDRMARLDGKLALPLAGAAA